MGAEPSESKGNVLLVVGVVGILGGIGMLVWGLAPAKELMDTLGPVFGGGTPPEDLSERMDAAFAKMKGRVVADILGFVALLAGFVLVKQAFAKPKPKSVEQLVQEEVARRLAVQPPAHGAASGPVATAAARPAEPTVLVAVAQTSQAAPLHVPDPQVAAVPPMAAAGRRTHCAACGSVLVAGGRLCPQGHPQA